MNVDLSPDLEAFVNAKVESGSFDSPAAVIAEALRRLEHEEQILQFQMHVDAALDEADRGEVVDGQTFMREMLKELDRRVDGKRPAE